MAFEEKHWWTYALIAVVVSAIYFANVLPKAANMPVTDIRYQLPLLIAGGAAVVLSILANIVIAITSAKGPKKDERDRDIHRLGEYVAGLVLAVGMVLPFGLTLTQADHFWIANAMYLAFVLSALAGSAVKLVAYRRGF